MPVNHWNNTSHKVFRECFVLLFPYILTELDINELSPLTFKVLLNLAPVGLPVFSIASFLRVQTLGPIVPISPLNILKCIAFLQVVAFAATGVLPIQIVHLFYRPLVVSTVMGIERVKRKSLNHVQLFATLFSRPEYWSG